jgi:hypothetical protein
MLTPFGFYSVYRDLDVALANGLHVYGLDVHEYRNARTYWAKRAPGAAPPARNDWDIFDGMNGGWYPLWSLIQKATIKKVGKRGLVVAAQVSDPVADPGPVIQIEEIEDWYDLLRVFEGKGSPDAIRQALRLAHLLGLIGVKGTPEGDMKRWCRDFIGLDCNGFVGNYLRHCGVAAPGASLFDTPETRPIGFAPTGKRLSKIGEVGASDILVWTNDSHIAIIDTIDSTVLDDKGAPTGLLVWVCESTGGRTVSGDVHTDGLLHTQYVIKSVGRDGVFQVARAKGWEKSGLLSKLKDGSYAQGWTEGVFISRLL